MVNFMRVTYVTSFLYDDHNFSIHVEVFWVVTPWRWRQHEPV